MLDQETADAALAVSLKGQAEELERMVKRLAFDYFHTNTEPPNGEELSKLFREVQDLATSAALFEAWQEGAVCFTWNEESQDLNVHQGPKFEEQYEALAEELLS